MAQKVRIIGVPMDLGQSRRGVDMGPSALRGAGLQASIKKLGLQVEDIGNLSVKQPEEMPVGEKRAKYLQEIAETCGDIAAAEKSLSEGFLPLVLAAYHPTTPHGRAHHSPPCQQPPPSAPARIWLSSTPPMLPASAPPSAAASPTAKPISPWK